MKHDYNVGDCRQKTGSDNSEKDSVFTTNGLSSGLPLSHAYKPRMLVLSHQAQLRLDLRMPSCLNNERSGNLGKQIYNNIQFEGLRPLPPLIGKPYKLIQLSKGDSLIIDRGEVSRRATIHCLSGCIAVTSQDGKNEETVVLSPESDVVVAPGVSVKLKVADGGWAEVLILEIGSQFASDDEPHIYA